MRLIITLLGFLLVSLTTVSHPYAVFEENGKVGLKDQQGKILIPAKYEAIGWSNSKFSVLNNVTGCRTAQGWGLINLSNQNVTSHDYSSLIPAEGGLIIAGKKLKSSPKEVIGCINSSGKQIIPFLYDGVSISSLRAIVFTKIGNQFKYGLIDLQNKTLIPQQYQTIQSVGTLRYAVKDFEGKIALFSENGVRITDFVIDSLSGFKDNFAIIYQGKFQGLIQRNGQIRLEARFREIDLSVGNKLLVRDADTWSFLDFQNKLIRKVRADSIVVLGTNVLKLKTGNQAQLVDGNIDFLGTSVLTNVSRFKCNKAIYKLGDLYGILLRNGNVLVPALYHQIVAEKDYILADQMRGGEHGWILFDSSGIRKTNRLYEDIKPFGSQHFGVKHKGFWGVVNSSGVEVIACAYDSLLQREGNNVSVRFKGLYGVISLTEEWVVAPKQNPIHLLDSHRYLEFAPTTTYLKERNGNVVYFTSNKLEWFSDYLLEYLPSGTVWKIDPGGFIIDREFFSGKPTDKIYEVSEGYRAIRKNGRFGFIDSRGRLRIANRYEDVKPFREGFAAVKILGKWGFINLQDNLSVQPVYDEVMSFKNGYALVKQKGLFGLIDISGRIILPVRYQKIAILPSGNFLVEANNLKGLADSNGRILIHPKYEVLEDLQNGFVIASRNNVYGIIGYNGVSIVPMIYDYIAYDAFTKLFLALEKSKWQEIPL